MQSKAATPRIWNSKQSQRLAFEPERNRLQSHDIRNRAWLPWNAVANERKHKIKEQLLQDHHSTPGESSSLTSKWYQFQTSTRSQGSLFDANITKIDQRYFWGRSEKFGITNEKSWWKQGQQAYLHELEDRQYPSAEAEWGAATVQEDICKSWPWL